MNVQKWLILQCEIDFLYCQLREILESLQKPVSRLEMMIDSACGRVQGLDRAVEICTEMKALKAKMSKVTGETYDTELEDKILAMKKSANDK